LEVDHYISKPLTQRLERTNGTLRQQTERAVSTTKQIYPGVGANEGYFALGHHLLQLDLGKFPRVELPLLNEQT
jgi:hypothetical protein